MSSNVWSKVIQTEYLQGTIPILHMNKLANATVVLCTCVEWSFSVSPRVTDSHTYWWKYFISSKPSSFSDKRVQILGKSKLLMQNLDFGILSNCQIRTFPQSCPKRPGFWLQNGLFWRSFEESFHRCSSKGS